ncbi:lymphocyte antigen 6L-like [Perognathus longimembris pacificus]|uniref:lymphocyte antigen 6L-like n=1 Tax=Perognathus longimembris pacificus TaxID=214514 RepID=UPI0020186701|nr:lymphocyte antigen 6L-like [Perognathus longimembris pacificus]
MEGLALAIWVSLVSAGLAGSGKAPGNGRPGAWAGRSSAPSAPGQTALPGWEPELLPVLQSPEQEQVPPHQVPGDQHVCISSEVAIFSQSRSRVVLSKRCAPRCPHASGAYDWSPVLGVQGRIVRRCCSRPLCNAAPAAPPAPLLLLPAALGLQGALR